MIEKYKINWSILLNPALSGLQSFYTNLWLLPDLREDLSVLLGSLPMILPSTPLRLRCHPECFLHGSSGRCLRQPYGLMVSELVGAGCSEKESWQLRFRRDCKVQIPISLFLPRSLGLHRANLGKGFLTGLYSSSEGMWLTELSHDSDVLPSIVGCPMGCVNISGCGDVFLSTLMASVKWFSWLHAVCGESYHCRTE